MKRILGFRISGSSLIECVVAMVILFGILSMMFTGFSIAGDYIVKGAALKDASSNALRQISSPPITLYVTERICCKKIPIYTT